MKVLAFAVVVTNLFGSSFEVQAQFLERGTGTYASTPSLSRSATYASGTTYTLPTYSTPTMAGPATTSTASTGRVPIVYTSPTSAGGAALNTICYEGIIPCRDGLMCTPMGPRSKLGRCGAARAVTTTTTAAPVRATTLSATSTVLGASTTPLPTPTIQSIATTTGTVLPTVTRTTSTTPTTDTSYPTTLTTLAQPSAASTLSLSPNTPTSTIFSSSPVASVAPARPFSSSSSSVLASPSSSSMFASPSTSVVQPPKAGFTAMVPGLGAGGGTTTVYLGCGCFWETQYSFTNIEMQCQFRMQSKGVQCKPFGRGPLQVTSRTGFAGGTRPGPACYDDNMYTGPKYSSKGHTEVTAIELDNSMLEAQFSQVLDEFFGLYQFTPFGMARPDQMLDFGSGYRSAIGIPGGMGGPLYPLVEKANKNNMNLVAGRGDEQDQFHTVYIYDSTVFPFLEAEQYHQFHSNFFGFQYPKEYVWDLYNMQTKAGLLPNHPVCPESRPHA